MKIEMVKIISVIKYKDAKSAIGWLCETFGFEKHLIVEGEDNRIEHAQLILGDSMIMLGSMDNNEYGKYFDIPKSNNGINTQAAYIVIEHIETYYEKVVSAKTKILIPLKREDYGGQSFTCRDMEGHL